MSSLHALTKPIPITQSAVIAHFPKRPQDSHKGLFGTAAIIGGASGMIGAPLLAARAALRMGAGRVHVGLMAENAPSVDLQQPELMVHNATAAMQVATVDVLALGCGMGRDMDAQLLLNAALSADATLVLDADALNVLALYPYLQTQLLTRKFPTVLTPHPGEAARLLGCSVHDIQNNRSKSAREIAQKFACIVVLKGANSICSTSDGKLYVNQNGNPGMSSAGMGDVLTGMIAAFIAQGMSADNALLLAVHLHGAAGDALAQQHATIGMTATEVCESARLLLNQWL
jgi:hydroxyethylthiazole kinase-like uncharacterized protein yjeF